MLEDPQEPGGEESPHASSVARRYLSPQRAASGHQVPRRCGKLAAKAESAEKRFLPGQKNSMHVEWAGKLPSGDYTALLTVAYGEDRIETQQVAFSVAE